MTRVDRTTNPFFLFTFLLVQNTLHGFTHTLAFIAAAFQMARHGPSLLYKRLSLYMELSTNSRNPYYPLVNYNPTVDM